MCELIISVIDKTHVNPEVDANLVKRGVVVHVFADDHDYGRMELTHPMFRILKLPGVSMAFGHALIGREISDRSAATFPLHRQFKIDVDHPDVPDAVREYLADDMRTAAHIEVDQALIEQLKCKRESRINPKIIGQHPSIIG